MPTPASYYQDAYHGQIFTATAAAINSTVGTATTYSGLLLTNPSTSNVNLVLMRVGISVTTPPAVPIVVGIMAASNTTAVTQGTAITPASTKITANSTTASGLASSNGTIPANATLRQIFGTLTSAANSTAPFVSNYYDLNDSMILCPGSFAALYTSAASNSNSVNASFMWSEVPR